MEGAGPGRLEQPAEQGAPAGGQFRVEEDEPRYRYDPSTGTLSSGLEAPKHGRDDLFGDMYASAGNGLPSPLDPGRRAAGERPVAAPGPPKRGVFDRLFGRRR